jgi:NAD(P)-dependent dehydrogenase (short-subunit alcohol dehydrogenase family)
MESKSSAPVAVVTGATRGIGRGIAERLAADGFDIVAIDIQADSESERLRNEISGLARKFSFLEADISDIESHASLVDQAFSAFGGIDCLVNNAGVQVKVRGDLLDVKPESFDRVIGINLRGTFFLTQAFARRMVQMEPEKANYHRSIITVSSVNAVIPAPDRPEYCFSKAGLSMMTKVFALRLASHGINTYEIRPGIIRTDMTSPFTEKYDTLIANGLTPIRRWGEPRDVATAVSVLARGLVPFSTGDAMHIDGGLHIPSI